MIEIDDLPTAQLLEQALQAEQMTPRRWLCHFGELEAIGSLPELARRYRELKSAKLAMMAGRLI